MKILLVNVVYSKGSTGNITESLYKAYKNLGHDVKVLYGRSSKVMDDPNIFKCTFELESKVHHFLSKFTGNMYGGMFISTNKIIKKIKKIHPDVVHIQCINGYFVNIYRLLCFLARNKFKTILTMHADFMMTGGCGYTVDCNKYLSQKCKNCERVHEFNSKVSLNRTKTFYNKMYKSISKFDIDKLKITCVSPWLSERYKESPIYKNYSVSTILNPVDDIFLEKVSNSHSYKNDSVLYVTSDIYDKEKSGFFIEILAEKLPTYNFTILCSKNVEYRPMHANINYVMGAKLSKEVIRNYYIKAELTILLSKRETYSMIVAESLACGTPVVGFKCGGPESVGFSKQALFVDYGDVSSLIAKIKEAKKDVVIDKKVDKESICREYLKLFFN